MLNDTKSARIANDTALSPRSYLIAVACKRHSIFQHILQKLRYGYATPEIIRRALWYIVLVWGVQVWDRGMCGSALDKPNTVCVRLYGREKI